MPYAAVATHVVVTTDAGLFLVEKPTVDRSRLVFDADEATMLTQDPSRPALAVNHATVALCAEALGAMTSALTSPSTTSRPASSSAHP